MSLECLQFPLPLPISPPLSSSWAMSLPHTASSCTLTSSRSVSVHSAHLKSNYLLPNLSSQLYPLLYSVYPRVLPHRMTAGLFLKLFIPHFPCFPLPRMPLLITPTPDFSQSIILLILLKCHLLVRPMLSSRITHSSSHVPSCPLINIITKYAVSLY